MGLQISYYVEFNNYSFFYEYAEKHVIFAWSSIQSYGLPSVIWNSTQKNNILIFLFFVLYLYDANIAHFHCLFYLCQAL